MIFLNIFAVLYMKKTTAYIFLILFSTTFSCQSISLLSDNSSSIFTKSIYLLGATEEEHNEEESENEEGAGNNFTEKICASATLLISPGYYLIHYLPVCSSGPSSGFISIIYSPPKQQ